MFTLTSKKMKRILLVLLTVVSIDIAYAQDQPKPYQAVDIKKMADDKKFKFTAQEATFSPSEGAERAGASISSQVTKDNHVTLTTTYTVVVTPDSVTSFLPYFDKSNTVADAVGSSTTIEEDASKASATAYDYEVKEKKNGSVVVNIKPKNNSKITKYNFDLSPDGKAKLEATIGNQIITYKGLYTN
jgi:hypothetical protein